MRIPIETLLKLAIQNKASDIHIRGDSKVFLRINGQIRPINNSEMTIKDVEDIIYPVFTNRLKNKYAENHEVDFGYDMGDMGRFRFNVFQRQGKITVVARHIPSVIPSMEQLRLPVNSLKKMLQYERGIVLVTGITGSGKSTTLASLINYVNTNSFSHIITLEDPIEFVFREKNCIISQRELGVDTNSFVDALRVAMRQDPDIIMVGEMRDVETTRAAITAAETGHLVFSTMHTMDAVRTINRIIDMYPPHQQTQVRLQLSESLKGVISQRLLPCTQGGRVAAVEVMINTPNVSKLIEENHLPEINKAMVKGAFYGMQSFNQALISLYKQGLCKIEDVLGAASNPEDVRLALRGIETGSGL